MQQLRCLLMQLLWVAGSDSQHLALPVACLSQLACRRQNKPESSHANSWHIILQRAQ